MKRRNYFAPPEPWKNIGENTATHSPFVLCGDGNVWKYNTSSYGSPWSNCGSLESFKEQVSSGLINARLTEA